MNEPQGTEPQNPAPRSAEKVKVNAYEAAANERKLWVIIAFLYFIVTYAKIGVASIKGNHINGYLLVSVLLDNIFPIFMVAFVPTLFYRIFGAYPISYILHSSSMRFNNSTDDLKEKFVVSSVSQSVTISPKPNIIDSQTAFIQESSSIAERIYSRAGIYLLAGCIIAFAGIAAFNSNVFVNTNNNDDEINKSISTATTLTNSVSNKGDSVDIALRRAIKIALIKNIINTSDSKDVLAHLEQKLLSYIPRFGALFFIEFIAIFFLRQYRIMLEEYRYYESIKRRRQDNSLFLDILEKNKDNQEILKLISERFSESTSHKLSKDETTQVLETQKATDQELDILGKVTELVKAIRPK